MSSEAERRDKVFSDIIYEYSHNSMVEKITETKSVFNSNNFINIYKYICNWKIVNAHKPKNLKTVPAHNLEMKV